jgi:hypothetical protein
MKGGYVIYLTKIYDSGDYKAAGCLEVQQSNSQEINYETIYRSAPENPGALLRG